jgi:hypothetical protein
MQIPNWPVVTLSALKSGSCFLDQNTYGRFIGLVAAGEKIQGQDMLYWVYLFSDHPDRPPGTMRGEACDGTFGSVLHLVDVELDFVDAEFLDLSTIHPDPHGVPRTPGTLMIAGSDYRVFTRGSLGERTVSFNDGSSHRETTDMMMVPCWRLIQRRREQIREICRIDVSPQRQPTKAS